MTKIGTRARSKFGVHSRSSIDDVAAQFIAADARDPMNRERSWLHCFNAFRDAELSDESLALHLSFYLASFGMYRGSSFLLQKNYLVHRDTVRMLRSPENLVLVGAGLPVLREQIADILKLGDRIRRCYPTNLITPVLVTKIMLGAFACVPAFDARFRNGTKESAVFAKLNERSLLRCFELYDQQNNEFERARQKIMLKGIDLPPMRMLDLYYWTVGAEKKNSIRNSKPR